MDLLQGTLDLLILKALKLGPMHGYGISVLIRQTSEEVLRVNQGSLYPALYRLERRGWIQSEWEFPKTIARPSSQADCGGPKTVA